MSVVQQSSCMPTAPAGVGAAEPRQLPERGKREQVTEQKEGILSSPEQNQRVRQFTRKKKKNCCRKAEAQLMEQSRVVLML